MTLMTSIAAGLAVLAGILHVLIFVMESLRFGEPAIWRRFGVRTQADALILKPMALNQGFYNLFLAIGAFLGGWQFTLGNPIVGRTLILFACGSMLAAALVLVISNPRLARAALIQGAIPLLAVIATLLG